MGESIWREEKIDGVTYKVVKKSFFIKNLEGFEELKEEEEERIVVAAPLEKLVRMLCHPWGLYDSHIGGILFSTYRSFSSSLQLLTTIFQWLDEVVEEARKDKSKQIQIRSIEGIIEDWVHNYPDDFNDPPTYPTLITLLQLSQQHNLISLSSVVRQSFQHFIKLTEATSDSDPIETPNQDNPLQEKLSLYKIVQQVLDDKENNNNNKDKNNNNKNNNKDKNNNSNNKDNNKNNNYEGNSTNDDDSGTFDVKRSSEVNSTNKRLSTLDDEEEDGGDDNDVDDGYINHLPATRSTSFDSYNMNNKNNNKLHPPLTPPINLINIPPRFFALQLTYADARLFSAVQRHHCLGSCWSNRRKKMAYLNTNNYPISVLATVDHFNAVSYRVISSILKRSTSSFHRSLVLSAWINIALECHLLKNYSSLKAILAGLQSNAIYRLKKLWSCLSKEKMELYRKLTDIFDENNNSALWRKLIMEEDALIKEEKVLRRRKTKMKAGTTSNSPVCGKPVCHEASSWGKTTRNKINWNIKDLELTSATSTSLSSFSSSSSPSSPFKGTIPYLGIFLTDLTMLDAALKDYEEEEEEEEDDGGDDDDDFRASMITDFSDEEENVNKNDNKNNNRNNNSKSNNEDYAGYSGLDSSRASYNVENDDSFDNKMNNNNNNNNNESKSLSTDTLENESPYEDKDNYNNKKRNNKHNKKNNKEMKKKKIRIINVDKKRREFEILERIHKLQAGLSYEGIEADTCFMQWFYYMRTYDDNESYELSLELEPNEVTHHQNNSNNNNNNNNNNNRKNNKGSLSPRDHYRNFNLGYFTIRKRSGEGNLNYFRFEPRTNKPTNHLKNLVALTQAPSKQLDTISMLVKSTPTTNPTNQKPPNGHPPKLLNYVKETNIIKAKVFLESSFSHETNQYKSIVIKNTDHTTAVLEKILQKFNLETLSVELFYMVQLLPDKKELKLPEKGNMYYAIKHVPDVTLLVRGRNEKQRKVGGPSRRRSSAVPFIKSIYPSFHPSAHHPSNNNPPSIHPSTHNEDCHVGFYKKIDPDCNNNYNHLYNNNITSNNNNNNNNSNNNNYHFKTSFNNIAINNTNNGNNINNNHNNKNNYCHVTTSNESLHSPLPHNHPSHPRRHFWQKNCVYEMEGGDKKRNRLSRIFGSVVSLVNS